ncbi:MAG: UvrD-helicase domain-containing protein, partial [Actinomycetes bacterium]
LPAGASLGSVVALVTKARSTPGCLVQAASGQDPERALADLVQRCVDEVDQRLAQSGGLSFGTLLTAARSAIESQPDVAEQVRRQFDAALIDEFQDTDPVQWEIFRLLFGRPGSGSTVLVGDPKQAIYSFRGGDVYTYLSAKQHADLLTLDTNQRSDKEVVQAMNALGEGEQFGESGIDFHVVTWSERHEGRRLVGADGSSRSGLEVRCLVDPSVVDRDEFDGPSARERIASDLADTARDLLMGGSIEAADGTVRTLRPGDVAVLVGGKFEADVIVDELRRRKIPVVVRAGDNVADSDAADAWRTLLFALDRPNDVRRALAASLTWFFGWTSEQLVAALDDAAEGGTEALATLQTTLMDWSSVLNEHGMPALYASARRSHDMLPRMLRDPLGERNLTDLEHLAELVHAAADGRRGLSGSTALTLMDNLRGTQADEVASDSVQRRIESDAAAVQIMTIHGSKGLEFPVVLLPGLWAGSTRVKGASPFSFYDRASGRRVLDVSRGKETQVGPRGGIKEVDIPDFAPRELATSQNCGDQHRLTYVAMTRAAHLTVAWWSPVTTMVPERTGLARLLFGGGATDAAEPVELPAPGETVQHLLDRMADRGASSVVRVSEVRSASGPVAPYEPAEPLSGTAPLDVSRLSALPDRAAHRWSFTQLSNAVADAAHQHAEGDQTDELSPDRRAGDEQAMAELPPRDTVPAGPDDWSAPPVLEDLGSGAAFGNLVHEMFEHLDFAAPDPEAAITEWLHTQSKFQITDEQFERLPGELGQVLRTPLGPEFGDLRLADLTTTHRLNELRFYFPLAPDGVAPARRIGALVADFLPPDAPLRDWAESLARGLRHIDLHGYMNGSIDLTLRYEVGGEVRYSVVDYKTNRLTGRGDEPRRADYHPDRLPLAMAHSNYPLQFLLYSVVLHRYLRWRLPDYAPDRHLGPVGYLFVRGMVGPDTPRSLTTGVPAGVFSWPLPRGLVPALSDLLAGLAPQTEDRP